MENWYGSFINQNNRHRELLEAAARERLANKCQAASRPSFRVQRLADLAVLIGIALMALGGVRHKGRSSQRRETQGTPGVAPRSVEA
jgi:hypothetical protein